jgi:DNA replication initiation complex subunit (GINS family)
LSRIWRKEREKQSLVSLPPDFFPRIQGQLAGFKNDAKGPLETSIVERIEFVLEDLVKLRAGKILAKIRLNSANTEIMHITREERAFVEPLSGLIPGLQNLAGKRDMDVSGLIIEHDRGNDKLSEEFKLRSNEVQMTQNSHADGTEKLTDSFKASKELVLARVVKPVEGKFVGTDGFQYGPLSIGDVVYLPYRNGTALYQRGVAVEIEIGWN